MTQHTNEVYTLRLLSIPTDTPITHLFKHYASKPWSILLDSAEAKHTSGQFDIFVADPVATLVVNGDTCEVHRTASQTKTLKGDPFKVLGSLLDDYLPKALKNVSHESPDLPFKAGALGYFGYDLGRQFEVLPNISEQAYHAADMAIGIYTWSIIKDCKSGQFYLFSLNDFPSPKAIELENLNIENAIEQDQLYFSLNTPWQSNMTTQEYLTKFDAIQGYLNAGDCYQVNLAQRFSAKYSGSTWQAYLALRKANQAPFSAYINLAETSILSISPERFLSVKDNAVETKPIKGTRPRCQDVEEDKLQIKHLEESEKDRAENLMIVDLLRNDLSKSCEDHSIKVPKLFAIETFEAVHHLVSTVEAKLKPEFDALDLLRGAFPGGSITGAPKIRAMQIIDELEPQRRNIYCGSIGYISYNGDMDTSICIRTLLCENQYIYCWAGGGIVVDSNGADEYQESLDKVSKILPVLERLGKTQ